MTGAVRPLRAIVCALALLLFSFPASALDGRELLQRCEALLRGAVVSGEQVTLPKGRAAAECWYYMGAVQDLSATVEREGGPSVLGSCVPEKTTRMELVRAFIKYARAHPKELRQRATALIVPALDESFPCSGSAQ